MINTNSVSTYNIIVSQKIVDILFKFKIETLTIDYRE